MNIQEAEKRTGITKRNIRFYEQKGMLTPARNRENDYRDYSEADIERLKRIRIFRMVDMPLEDIQNVLEGKISLEDAAATQQEQLYKKIQDTETAIYFCKLIKKQGMAIDADAILREMDAPQNRNKLFSHWINDYKKLTKAWNKATFTFIPDDPVTNPQEFTDALLEFAQEQGVELTITKKGMYPEFILDGIEYTAERHYTSMARVPMAIVRCRAKHPELLEPNLDKREKYILQLFRYSWVLVVLIVVCMDISFRGGGLLLFTSWEGWVILVSILTFITVSVLRFNLFFQNNRNKS